MASHLSVAQLQQALRTPETIAQQAFSILKTISTLVNDPSSAERAREMILRALEYRDEFGDSSRMLDALARTAGFFPYLDPDDLDLRDRLAYEAHRPINMPEDFVFHREQAKVYWRILSGDNVILSAPTSFGKSRIIDAIIATRKFKNIAVIVPTLALIDETRRRLLQFSSSYKIVTHLSQQPAESNIFVLTAERAVSYKFPKIDFFVIDEFYKLDDPSEDPARKVALNHVFYKLMKQGGQFYLLGPSIKQIPGGVEDKFQCYFYATNYSTVVAEQKRVPGRGRDIERLIELAKTLDEPTIVFCRSPRRVNDVAHAFLEAGVGVDSPELRSAAEWAATTYHADWVFGHALMHGIGMHHGRLPRALSQYVVRMFNELRLRFLVCTSTLIEGVNTKAKNVIVFDNQIALKQIDYFTFNNIKGRSGRMFEHFVGHVYLFHEPPQETLPFVDFPVFSQGQTVPDSLLVQLEGPDLSEEAEQRVNRFAEQKMLPLSVIRENSGIDLDSQLHLAMKIAEDSRRFSSTLAWRGFPTYEQFKSSCELIWEYLVDSRGRGGVYSGRQLAQKLWQLQKSRAVSDLIRAELTPGRYAAKSPDDAVERVLEFERTWASFEFPRYLMALSRIQQAVLSRLGLEAGDYATFASQAECLFRNPVVVALDEYGVPLELAEKIQPQLGTTDDLDLALRRLKGMRLDRLSLTAFEREILEDTQKSL